jgi:predicted N-formylglutamate amidohydrolase
MFSETAACTIDDFDRRDPQAPNPVVITCDHASNAVPAELHSLGLDVKALTSHIAWDIGAAALSLELAQRIGCVVLRANWSRLVIDCNRSLQDPTSILEVSDGVRVPGNERLSAAERAQRADRYWRPYHARVEAELARRVSSAGVPALLSIHSFTPVFGGRERAWHAGILWDRDPRIAVPLLAALTAEQRLLIGDNEPYSGRHPADYTIDVHAEAHGWPHVCIEVRQDLLATVAGVKEWAERLHDCLRPILGESTLYRVMPVPRA